MIPSKASIAYLEGYPLRGNSKPDKQE
jgi:hypothetical protein